jgi:hypothetical protein
LDEAEFDPMDFPPPKRRAPAKLYLISPQEVGGTFPDRLKAALEPGIAAALQLRVKDLDEHQLARLAEPLQRICADADVAFIVNDSMALAKRIGRGRGAPGPERTVTCGKRGRCSVPARRSAGPVTTAAIWRWKRERRGRTMSPSALSIRR